jgi:hypothetical protein
MFRAARRSGIQVPGAPSAGWNFNVARQKRNETPSSHSDGSK